MDLSISFRITLFAPYGTSAGKAFIAMAKETLPRGANLKIWKTISLVIVVLQYNQKFRSIMRIMCVAFLTISYVWKFK